MIAVSGGIVLSLCFFETWPRSEFRFVTFDPSFSSWSWISWCAMSAHACINRSRSGARFPCFLPPVLPPEGTAEVRGAMVVGFEICDRGGGGYGGGDGGGLMVGLSLRSRGAGAMLRKARFPAPPCKPRP